MSFQNGPRTNNTQLVRSEGIFHGLPCYPDSIEGLRAMVVGASGQSGQPMIDVLSSDPQRWAKVYALSRRPPTSINGSNVEHVPTDLLWSHEKIVSMLREHAVQVEYIFFFGYVILDKQGDDEIFGDPKELADINGRMLENFLKALDEASIHPKRIVLQTGGKNYNIHLGHANVPLREYQPRVELEPNFYYTQQDLLAEYVKTHPNTGYNVTMPQWILGAVGGTDMTIFHPIAVYAAVQRKLNQPLRFPGDLTSWDNPHPISTGLLLARFHEWLVLSPDTASESFNITDGSEFTFGHFWPILASWFKLECIPPSENDHYKEVETSFAPRGYGPKGKMRSSFSLIEWAQEPASREAWKQLAEEHNLTTQPLANPERTFAFLQFALELTWSWSSNIDKSRKYGWLGHCDSIESMRVVFDKFANMKMIPPMP